MTTDDTKRDLWKEVQQEREEKKIKEEDRELLEWITLENVREHLDFVVEDTFISQISPTKFIVDNIHGINGNRIFTIIEYLWIEEYDFVDIFIDTITEDTDTLDLYDEGYTEWKYHVEFHLDDLGKLLTELRNNENWMSFNEENLKWLVKVEGRYKSILEEVNYHNQFEEELGKRTENKDELGLTYDRKEMEYKSYLNHDSSYEYRKEWEQQDPEGYKKYSTDTREIERKVENPFYYRWKGTTNEDRMKQTIRFKDREIKGFRKYLIENEIEMDQGTKKPGVLERWEEY